MLGLNDGRFAFVMFDLDLDITGNKKKNLTVTFGKDWSEEAFQSALLLSVNNKVSAEYLTFNEDVKRRSSGSPFFYSVNPGLTVSENPSEVSFTHIRNAQSNIAAEST